jgi:hypothetical protein
LVSTTLLSLTQPLSPQQRHHRLNNVAVSYTTTIASTIPPSLTQPTFSKTGQTLELIFTIKHQTLEPSQPVAEPGFELSRVEQISSNFFWTKYHM